jgi:hypothetical protein
MKTNNNNQTERKENKKNTGSGNNASTWLREVLEGRRIAPESCYENVDRILENKNDNEREAREQINMGTKWQNYFIAITYLHRQLLWKERSIHLFIRLCSVEFF